VNRPSIRCWYLFGLLSVLILSAERSVAQSKRCAATPTVASFGPAAGASDSAQSPISTPSPESTPAREPADTAPAPSPAPQESSSTWVIDLESGAVRAPGAQDAWLPPAGGSPPDPAAEAARVLQGFLDRLSGGRTEASSYEWAAELYGGGYPTLVEINSEIDPADHAALLRNACEGNGHQCLRLREALSTEAVVGENGLREFRFTVTLLAPDGAAFSRGPCCGEEAGDPEAGFVFTVRQMEDGAFKVFDLPPYVP